MLLAQLHGSMSRTDACSIPATWSASRCLSMADVTGWINAARCLTWRNLSWCEVTMGFETLFGIAAAVIAAIAGAFGLGHIRGSSKAEAKADQQRTEENAAATVAAAERKAEVTKEASNVQQTVNHMPDDDVDRELRENFTRPGGD